MRYGIFHSQVQFSSLTPDDADDDDAIKAILNGDTYLLSFEEKNSAIR